MTVEIELRHDALPDERPFEVVERKGLGHPDTICDHLSEAFSVALSRYYLETFGLVLHHNVDKILLAAGRTAPAFGNGRILKPFRLFIGGRATAEVEGRIVPVQALAEETMQTWLRTHLHACDPAANVRIHCLTEPGSADLVQLFMAQRQRGVYLANDTSCGIGFAPLSTLEQTVLNVERALNAASFKERHPESGEDIKVMGVRVGERISLTISCAFISRFLSGPDDYVSARETVAAHALLTARQCTGRDVHVRVNTSDDIAAGRIYLTVSGTSAEAGDDGETGRGNRMNGLITPMRPMSLEAVAGKNPITHVGKLYTAAAHRISASLVSDVPGVTSAECILVSQIGQPITSPAIAHAAVRSKQAQLLPETRSAISDIIFRELHFLPDLWREFLSGHVEVV